MHTNKHHIESKSHHLNINSRRALKSLVLISLLSLTATQLLFSQEYNIVFTENANNTLQEAMTIPGSGIFYDYWILTSNPSLPYQIWQNTAAGIIGTESMNGPLIQWREPENPNEVNYLLGNTVESDVPPPNANYPILPDGGTALFTAYGTMINGIDGATHEANVTFVDSGDSPIVPDASPTLPLSVLACLSLVVMRRYATPHIAPVNKPAAAR